LYLVFIKIYDRKKVNLKFVNSVLDNNIEKY